MTITDLHMLPDEVLCYSHNQFYKFIEDCLGVDEMNLLKVQSIRNIRTLINVPNIFSILRIKCKQLTELKDRICFIDEDDPNNFVIKSGIETGMTDLITVLKEKHIKYVKKTKNKKS